MAVTKQLIGISILCKDTHVYIISKVIGINKEKEICLQNKETQYSFEIFSRTE